MAPGDRFGRMAVVALAGVAVAAGSAVAVSSGSGGGAAKAPPVPSAAPTHPAGQAAAAIRRGPRGKAGPRGLRGRRGLPGAAGAAGATGPAGPSAAVAVRDPDLLFPNVTGDGVSTAPNTVISTALGAGAWVIHAKLGVTEAGVGGRVRCSLTVGADEADIVVVTVGNGAGSTGQAEIVLMSATTLATSTPVSVVCSRDGGSAVPFVSQQQILAMKVGSATTTVVAVS